MRWPLPLGGTWSCRPPSVAHCSRASSMVTTSSRNVSVPVLVTHGRDDTIVLPSMAERTLTGCPAATASWYDGVGHMPFLELPDRFDYELASLARNAGN